MPLFYGLYVADEKLAAAFDLIRFLAEPKFFRRAHITIRGPYSDRIPEQIARIEQQRSYTIHFVNIGSFFTGRQNTVFLKCEIPGIERIWSKPDYGNEITPHLTFYDGKDRFLGYHIQDLLKQHDWDFTAQSTELTEIQTKTDPGFYLDRFEVHQKLYDEILGAPVDYRAIQSEQSRQRLIYMNWVLDFLEKNYMHRKNVA